MANEQRAALRKTAWLAATVWLASMMAGCESGGDMAILDVDPKVGHTQGDQHVKILGQNFRQDIGYTVYFGAQKAGSVTILDDKTMVVTTPSGNKVGGVDITIRADNGHAFRISESFKFEEMGGSVVQGLGETATGKDKGNLAF